MRPEGPGIPLNEVQFSPEARELCACWINEHGEPYDWSDETWEAYQNTIVHASAAGAL